nr:hypothetical protein BaRGS_028564 [Batillaria attramentaria]
MGEVKNAIKRHRVPICLVVKVLVFLLYLAYTVYSLYRTWGTESATRLLVLLVIVLYAAVGRRLLKLFHNLLPKPTTRGATASKLRKIARWSLYVLAAGGAIVFLAVEVIPHHPNNLVCLLGLAALFIACLAMSTDPTHVNWHPVFWGSALQFYLAIFILRTQAGIDTFAWLSDRVLEFTRYTDAGTSLLFGQAYTMHPYAFQLLPVFIFVNAALAVGHHFGIIEGFVSTIGRVLSFCLGTTAVESVSAAANIFLSALEAPLLVFPYLAKCSESEIFAVMTGGFASVPADHLLAASVMSAPAALAIAKIVCPETSDTNTDSDTVRIEAE